MKNSERLQAAQQRNHAKFRLKGAVSIKNIPIGVFSRGEKENICTAIELIETVLKNWDNENRKLGFSSKPIYEVTNRETEELIYRGRDKKHAEDLVITDNDLKITKVKNEHKKSNKPALQERGKES